MEPDKHVRYLIIIIGLTLAIYANTLRNDFVSDDIPAIVTNPNISRIFSVHDSVNLTFHLNYLIGKLNPIVYHLTNIILHLLNSILVFFFLSLFFKPAPSFWGSLIFVSHPIHTEAVTWISGRPYLIFTCFLLLSFLLYARSTYNSNNKLKKIPFLISLLMFFLSLYSASFALIFPGMLILYDFTFRRWKRNYKLWPAFFALALLKLLLMGEGIRQRAVYVGSGMGETGMSNPVFNMAYSVFAHLSLLIWPVRLSLYHEPNIISGLALGFEISLLVLLFFSLPLIFKKAKIIFFAICFFILFLAPTYSPVAVSWLVAERYLYLPSLALSISAAFLIDRYAKEERFRKWFSILLIALIASYSCRTILRNRDWRTHASIWKATVEASPKSPKAHNNMGDVYSLEGNLEKASAEFIRAIELKPDYADAYHNLANSYQKMGRTDEAIWNYQKAVYINPLLYQSYLNLGIIYLNRHQDDLAKEYFRKVLKIKPDHAGARRVLEQLENTQGNR